MGKNIFKNISFFLLIIISVLILSTNETNSQNKKATKKNKATQVISIDTLKKDTISKSNPPSSDTVIADREVVFDLEKLSKIASIYVYGTKELREDGLVVLEIAVDETGKIYSATIRDSNNKKLNRAAVEATHRYAQRYKLQPAIKNGKPVEQTGIMVPVLFDMGQFNNNSQ